MGSYADRLSSRLRNKAQPKPRPDAERLSLAAIKRDGIVHTGARSHYELRSGLGDPQPQVSNLNDVEGFMTSTGRFITRAEAQDVALAAGQIRELMSRPLLSSDIDW